MNLMLSRRALTVASLAGGVLGLALLGPARVRAQQPLRLADDARSGQPLRLADARSGQAREFTVTGNQFAFSPSRIEVQKDDVVKIVFTASDIAHSFTIDQYRIAKRANAGQTVIFEFHADQSGTFPFYCNLTQNDRCKDMKGQFVVK